MKKGSCNKRQHNKIMIISKKHGRRKVESRGRNYRVMVAEGGKGEGSLELQGAAGGGGLLTVAAGISSMDGVSEVSG